MKHTPGPWHVANAKSGKDFGILTFDKKHVLAEAFCDIREVSDSGLVEAENNARLIAAAPDLLEACKTFAEWLRREEAGFVKIGNTRDTPEGEAAWRKWFNENLRICDLAQKQALDAIAKSTGSTT